MNRMGTGAAIRRTPGPAQPPARGILAGAVLAGGMVFGTLAGLPPGTATAADQVAAADIPAELAPYVVGDKKSGYFYASPETRAMQDDDFENPSFLWLERGAELWTKVDGKVGKSCADCHGDAEESMKGVATRYPVYEPAWNKMKNLEQQIQVCRTFRMEADNWPYESDELLSMTTYVANQSKGMPINVSIDGPAHEFWEKGKKFYETRRGQLNMACTHCHVDHEGTLIRAELLSQGQGNGFPLYRLKWQGLGSLHRRFRGCNDNIRAEPFPYGSDTYINLELYVMWRGNGLPVETPAVRK